MADGGENAPDAEIFKKIVEGTQNYAQFMLDRDGDIVEWLTGAHTLYGYDPDEAVGKPLTFLLAESEEAPTLEALLPEEREAALNGEGWHERADDAIFWANFTVSQLSNGTFDGYAVIAHDTTEQKQHARMLERQNDRLKEFTDILSHDLRNPLNVVKGRIKFYRETGDESHLDTAEQSTERMERLIDDLLRVAQQGQVVTDPVPVDIETVIEVAREGTLPPSATLEYDLIPEVMGQQDRLVQVFENFFRNSVEHGGEDVTVRVGPLKDGFYVVDDGLGIPEADRDRVFAHGYTTRKDGTGYGLSVVRSVIGAHGWDISVTDSKDTGARFEIRGVEFVSDDKGRSLPTSE